MNVHPQKTEVRFRREGLIFSVVENAVKDALGAGHRLGSFRIRGIASSLTTSLEGCVRDASQFGY